MQEELAKKGLKLREMSVVEIRQQCYAWAARFAPAQSEQFQRLGILGDWDRPYWTMSPEYEAKTLDAFAAFVEAGLFISNLSRCTGRLSIRRHWRMRSWNIRISMGRASSWSSRRCSRVAVPQAKSAGGGGVPAGLDDDAVDVGGQSGHCGQSGRGLLLRGI